MHLHTPHGSIRTFAQKAVLSALGELASNQACMESLASTDSQVRNTDIEHPDCVAARFKVPMHPPAGHC
jgi:hypothetical protein